jgi:hypothetical protein
MTEFTPAMAEKVFNFDAFVVRIYIFPSKKFISIIILWSKVDRYYGGGDRGDFAYGGR